MMAGGLNEDQIKFCELYALSNMRGNGVQCYLEVYDTNPDSPLTYGSARSSASRLLTDANILAYIRDLYETTDLNDTVVDNELAFIIKQNADFGSKLGGIKEYNQLKSRVKQKIEHSGNVGLQVIITPIEGNDPIKED